MENYHTCRRISSRLKQVAKRTHTKRGSNPTPKEQAIEKTKYIDPCVIFFLLKRSPRTIPPPAVHPSTASNSPYYSRTEAANWACFFSTANNYHQRKPQFINVAAKTFWHLLSGIFSRVIYASFFLGTSILPGPGRVGRVDAHAASPASQ